MKIKRVRVFLVLIGFLLLTAFSINRLVYYNQDRNVLTYDDYNDVEKVISFMESKSLNYEIKNAANDCYIISVKARDLSKYHQVIFDYIASNDT